MYGTFNVQIPFFRISEHPHTILQGGKRYWFVKIRDTRTDNVYFGWAIRDLGSKQRENTLEILTKRLLPETLKTTDLDVEIPDKWDDKTARLWAKDKYWFQSFSFAPQKKADTDLVWRTIDIIDWTGLDVLDWGCHYGYISFEASKRGAVVIGVDNNKTSLSMAKTIREHIVQQDVQFVSSFAYKHKAYDVVTYLSVHHQRDPNYGNLVDTVKTVRNMARKHAFIELILPPTFPTDKTMTEKAIDHIVGGTVLLRYRHNVRGTRKIYSLEI
jgi:hypothetical protein